VGWRRDQFGIAPALCSCGACHWVVCGGQPVASSVTEVSLVNILLVLHQISRRSVTLDNSKLPACPAQYSLPLQKCRWRMICAEPSASYGTAAFSSLRSGERCPCSL
jgi:hypothetical protein